MGDGSQRYMVLDGANRITALGKMGCPHAVIQVVKAYDPGLKLCIWNHVIWGMDSSHLVSVIEQVPDIHLVKGEGERPDLWGDCGLAMIQVAEGEEGGALLR